MKSSKGVLVAGLVTVGLLIALPAVATVMAYRISSLGCVPAKSSSYFKILTPSLVLGTGGIGGAGGIGGSGGTGGSPTNLVLGPDWGVNSMDPSNEMYIYCPVEFDSETVPGHQPLVSAKMMFSTSTQMKCTFYLQEGPGGGVLTSIDMSGTGGSMADTQVVSTDAAPGYDLATSNLNRGFFFCTLPKATTATPSTATALLKALEVQYGQ